MTTRLLRVLLTLPLILLVFSYAQNSSASGTYGAYTKVKTDLYKSGEFKGSARNETEWSLTYSVNSLIESEIDSSFHYLNPGSGGFKFGFGDTEVSTAANIANERDLMPGMILQATALVPVEHSPHESVSQIYEFEYVLGLKKELGFISIQTNLGYFAANDQISDRGFDHNFIYGLEVEIPLLTEDIICVSELNGDFTGSNIEYPALIKSGVVYELSDRIALDGGIELGIDDPEVANIIFGMNFSI